MARAVFFDRDGTLIRDKHYLSDPEEVEWLPGVFDALKRLHQEGLKLIVITNQSGVGRGFFSEEALKAVHNRIQKDVQEHCEFELDGFYYSTFNPERPPDQQKADIRMRKPEPGMIEQASTDHQLVLARSYMVGDKLSDVIAGKRAGCRTVLVRTGKTNNGVSRPSSPESTPDAMVEDVSEAAEWIMRRNRQDR